MERSRFFIVRYKINKLKAAADLRQWGRVINETIVNKRKIIYINVVVFTTGRAYLTFTWRGKLVFVFAFVRGACLPFTPSRPMHRHCDVAAAARHPLLPFRALTYVLFGWSSCIILLYSDRFSKDTSRIIITLTWNWIIARFTAAYPYRSYWIFESLDAINDWVKTQRTIVLAGPSLFFYSYRVEGS